MNIRYAFSFLRIMKIPGLFSIMQDWQAFIRMHFVFAAYETGLLDALKRPCNRDTLIQKLYVKRPDLLDALLEVGIACKELALKNEMFHLRGKRSKAIAGAHGDMLAAMVQGNVTYYSDAYRNAAKRIRGGELGDDLSEIGSVVARFSKIAEPIIKNFIAAVSTAKNPLRVLDVGCGSGVHLQSVYNINRNATGVGLDIDGAVVQQAKDNIISWGLKDRFDIFQGDIRHPPAGVTGPFDLITLYNILYYFHEEDRLELLKNLRSLLAPHGIIAVAMNCRSRGKDLGAANLNMVNCSLKGLTPLPDLNDITSCLLECGFGKTVVHSFMPGSTFYGIVAYATE